MLNWPTQRIAMLVLITLLGCGSGLYYGGYRQWQHQRQQLAAMATCLKPLPQQINQQAQRLDQLEQQLAQQVDKRQFNQRFEQQAQALLHLQQMNALQEQQLQKLQQQLLKVTGSPSKDWRLIEIHSLLRKADRKLWLEQDLVAARRLLQRAELRLATLKSPALLSIRQALAEDNRRLAAVALPDDGGLMLQIMMLVDQLDPPPFVTMSQPAMQQPESLTTLANGGANEHAHWYQPLLHSLRHYGAQFIRHFITIQRHAGHVGSTAPQGAWSGFYHQSGGCTTSRCESLRAYLLLAAQAASRHQCEHYQQWLGGAVAFIQTHFDPQLPSVILLLEKIEQLRQHARITKLPQPLQSQRLLEGFLQCWIEDRQLPALPEQPGD